MPPYSITFRDTDGTERTEYFYDRKKAIYWCEWAHDNGVLVSYQIAGY